MSQKPFVTTVSALLLLGCAPVAGVPQQPSTYKQEQPLAPTASAIGGLMTPAPTRTEHLNPALGGALLLQRFVDQLMGADTTIHPSPYPGQPSLAPIPQPRPVITAQHIDLRTAQWVKDHLTQSWTGDLTMDSPVWVADIEGDIPMTALPNASGQAGTAHRIVLVLSAETGMTISMVAY